MKARSLGVFLALVFVAAPVSAQGLLPALQGLRLQYPTPMSKEQIGELLTRAVQTDPTNWVLLRKPNGNNCPALGTLVSCDYIIEARSGQGFDMLIDQEGEARPTWNPGDSFTPAVYVWAVNAPAPTPTPTPVPPPVSTDLGPILDLLGEFQAQNGQEHTQIRQELAAIRQQVEGIVLVPPPSQPADPAPVPIPDSGSNWLAFTAKYIAPAVGALIAGYFAANADAAEPAK